MADKEGVDGKGLEVPCMHLHFLGKAKKLLKLKETTNS